MINDKLIAEVFRFLKAHAQEHQPVLLGFSGGPDSLALLHVLLQLRQEFPLEIALAHVDHGWRAESAAEANEVEAMGSKLGVRVHIKTLALAGMRGNLEASCREERLKYFSELAAKHGYQAVLLGHHADDHAETVLKRLFEGAPIMNLCGLNAETKLHGIKVWRPLLTVTKRHILEWLKQKKLKGFDDRTNADPKFLRARLRTTVMPYLSETFGKQISAGLCHLGNDSAELMRYLDENTAVYLGKVVAGVWGCLLDLSEERPHSGVELKHVVRRFGEMMQMPLSRESVAQAAALVANGAANKSMQCGAEAERKVLHIDRGRLCIFNTPGVEGQWNIEMVPIEGMGASKATDWRSLLNGKAEVVLPQGQYELAVADGRSTYGTTSLSEWWTDHKMPAFMRPAVPVLLADGEVRHEFLTGKVKACDAQAWVKVSLSLRN